MSQKLKPACDISIVARMLHWATAQLAVLFIILGWLGVAPQVRSISVVYSFDSDAKLQVHWRLEILI